MTPESPTAPPTRRSQAASSHAAPSTPAAESAAASTPIADTTPMTKTSSAPAAALLRTFLEVPYDQLEQMNLEAKQQRMDRIDPEKIRKERLKYLEAEKRIKAVTVCFTDLEGRLHMLDYDKKFLLKSHDNLTFDGSSIRGFSQQSESDLRLAIDWPAFYWLPSDVFGPGKVLAFGEVLGRDGKPYGGDLRGQLKTFLANLYKKEGLTCYAANEIEGFIFKGRDAERHFPETGRFEYVLDRRLLPLATERSAPPLHRRGRRGAARDGLCQ